GVVARHDPDRLAAAGAAGSRARAAVPGAVADHDRVVGARADAVGPEPRGPRAGSRAALTQEHDNSAIRCLPTTTIVSGGTMNWDQIAGNWKQFAGKAKENWGKLTDDDWTRIAGKRDQLVGKIQERYGIAKDAAEKQVKEYETHYKM